MPATGVLRQAIGGQRRRVAQATLLLVTHQAAEALVPVAAGAVIDAAVATGDAGALLRWIVLLAVLFAVLSNAYRLGARRGEAAVEYAAHDLRLAVARRILDPRGGADAGRLQGELLSIAGTDATHAGEVGFALPQAAAIAGAVLVAAAVLLGISTPLGLLVLLGLPPLLALVHFAGRPLERRAADEQARAARAAGIATDLVTGIGVIKGIGAEAPAIERYRRASRESLRATLRAARAEAVYNGAATAVTGTFLVLVALVGGRLAAGGTISIGELIAAVGLTQFLVGPLSSIARVGSVLLRARASAGRIAAVLSAPPDVPGGPAALPRPLQGALRLRAVSHGPLTEVDLEVRPGELLGLVVPDPAHAAALLACLARDADPASGSVELDGVPLHDVDPDAGRAAVLVVPHDPDLFDGTLLENVAAAAGEPRHVDPALEAADIADVAAALSDGTATRLSERGRSLSGGQRQRVALARALAANAPVLVLHDPSTAVDAATEARIARGLRAVRDGRTTLVVTTSPALLAVTDRVAAIDERGVVVEGTHETLVAGDERYRRTVLA